MSTIRLSQAADVLRLKHIWKECFGDSDQFIDFYFAQFYKPEQTMVLLTESEIAAMLTMIPITLRLTPTLSLPCVMLYAIATHPAYQGKGLAGELMAYSNDYAAANGSAFSVLVPASASLFSFYKKLSYEEAFPVWEAAFTLDENPVQKSVLNTCDLSLFSAESYNEMRNRLCAETSFVAYDTRSVSYQKKLSTISGADLYRIACHDSVGCVAIERVAEQKLFIKELILPQADPALVLSEICAYLSAKECFVRSPLFTPALPYAAKRNFAMYNPIGSSNALLKHSADIQKNETYLGLAFD